jgi:response regulator RpfG family c-di-GMP phosphodiesterase
VSSKILFVDDEPSILEGYLRMLHGEFVTEAAVGGEEGLTAISTDGPFAVVISDMRMPGMSGAQFLAEVRRIAPETVRLRLTGFADIETAMEAVNEGNVFRFLTKPCAKPALAGAIRAGLAQHRLIAAERVLLEETLMGSIKVLTDVLGIANPAAYGRSMRIARYVSYFTGKFVFSSPWQFEAAAMLSQLGCVTLKPDLVQAAYAGLTLPEEDQARFAAHPEAASNLLVNIPRMEAVAWMIGKQMSVDGLTVSDDIPDSHPEEIVLGAKILKLAVAFDDLKLRGFTDQDSIAWLRIRRDEFGVKLIDELDGLSSVTSM